MILKHVKASLWGLPGGPGFPSGPSRPWGGKSGSSALIRSPPCSVQLGSGMRASRNRFPLGRGKKTVRKPEPYIPRTQGPCEADPHGPCPALGHTVLHHIKCVHPDETSDFFFLFFLCCKHLKGTLSFVSEIIGLGETHDFPPISLQSGVQVPTWALANCVVDHTWEGGWLG